MTLFQKVSKFWKENPILRKLARNFGYLFSSNMISAALSMVQGIFSARLLGVAGFGILGTITIFITVINKLTSFRMGELVIKYVGEFHENDDNQRAAALFKAAALTELLASLVAFGLVCLVAPFGAQYFAKDAGLAPWFIVYGLIILANMISESSTGLLQFFDRFRRMAGLNVLQSVVTLGLIILAWWQDTGLLGVLVAYLVGKVISAVGLTLAAQVEAVRRWGVDWWKTPLRLLAPHSRDLLRFAVSTNLSSSLSLISRDSGILWVSFFSSPTQAGYYKLAIALTNYIQLPIAPMPQATYPEMSRAVARKNWLDFRYLMKTGTRLAGAYSILVALGLVLLGRPLIEYLYTSSFLPTYNGLLIMLIGIVFGNSLYWARSALLSLGMADHATRVNFLITILSVAGLVFLLPVYGFIGSALVLSFGSLLGNSLVILRVRSELNKQEILYPSPQEEPG
ncbi:lipopolysaccharide biosynthesis protein [Chloroflexota bacterium]